MIRRNIFIADLLLPFASWSNPQDVTMVIYERNEKKICYVYN